MGEKVFPLEQGGGLVGYEAGAMPVSRRQVDAFTGLGNAVDRVLQSQEEEIQVLEDEISAMEISRTERNQIEQGIVSALGFEAQAVGPDIVREIAKNLHQSGAIDPKSPFDIASQVKNMVGRMSKKMLANGKIRALETYSAMMAQMAGR